MIFLGPKQEMRCTFAPIMIGKAQQALNMER